MNKLEELINKLCPNGVEYKKLEDITKSVNIGINPRKFFKLNPDDATGFYVTVRELNGLKGVNQTEKTDLINDEAINIIQARANIENGDILFSNTGTVGKMALVNYDTLNWGVNEGIYVIKPNNEIISSKFLYYYLDSNLSYADYSKLFTGSTMKHITQKALLSISIPVPPLEVQDEIVHILDDFTSLLSELSLELIARQKQYEYYKNKLLVFDRNDTKISWISLGECCKRLKGTAITAGQMKKIACEGGEVRIFAGGKTVVDTTPENINQGDIITVPNIIVQSRGIIDFIYYEKPCSFKREMWSYTNDNKVTLKYIYYYLKKNVEFFRKRGSQMGSMPQISLDVTEKYMIPIPSIAEQERVVNILEKFDELCNNISYGLPAEIEKRQKQYEYYRDKLLSFKEVEVNE